MLPTNPHHNPSAVCVESRETAMRLDKWLVSRFPQRSRAQWQRAIQEGIVTVNGRAVRVSFLVEGGEQVAIAAWPKETTQPQLAAIDKEQFDPSFVVYADDFLLVVNKPRGVVVHPSKGHWEDSVVHRLLPLLETDAANTLRPGIVHRLDRDTTGLLMVARQERIRAQLSEALQKREVHRVYLAVVQGGMDPVEGTIEAPIGRDPRNRLRMAVVSNGRFARTHYRTIARWRGFSLLQCVLDTGRTHQIRVHLAALGHPVVGDVLYGASPQVFPPGQALHAGQLSLRHPVTQQLLCFQAPLPADWQALSGQLLQEDILQPQVFPQEIASGCPPVDSLTYLNILRHAE
ncbi:MAG: RluA family pseudouridine synthase [Firmicutes bacterium]|nr:RluA family pseudouridine synthase [Bacillota bacterium]